MPEPKILWVLAICATTLACTPQPQPPAPPSSTSPKRTAAPASGFGSPEPGGSPAAAEPAMFPLGTETVFPAPGARRFAYATADGLFIQDEGQPSPAPAIATAAVRQLSWVDGDRAFVYLRPAEPGQATSGGRSALVGYDLTTKATNVLRPDLLEPAVAAAPATKWIALTEAVPGSGERKPGVTLLDPAGGEPATLATDYVVRRMAWSPAGDALAFEGASPALAAPALFVLDPATKKVTFIQEIGQGDDAQFFWRSGAREIMLMDYRGELDKLTFTAFSPLGERRTETRIDLSALPQPHYLSGFLPDEAGERVLAERTPMKMSRGERDGAAAIDLASGRARPLATVGTPIAWLPEGRGYLYVVGAGADRAFRSAGL